MKPWKRIEPTIVSKIGYRTMVSKTYELPNGKIHHFETIDAEGQEFVVVLALTKDNKVVIARQFRVGPEQVFDELPGGFVDAGEDPAITARRELLEETGYEAEAVTFLGTTYNSAYGNAKRHGFIATGCTLSSSGTDLDQYESVELALLSIEEVIDNARRGKMSDIWAVFLAYDMLHKIQGDN
jgi:ADP-ribose pyrophosphatase